MRSPVLMSDTATVRRSITILMADDDEDDRVLTADALKQSRLINDLRFVVDGEDLMHYLRGHGAYAEGGIPAPRPGLILLDLNMPKKDGREALSEIKTDPDLRRIPVVVVTHDLASFASQAKRIVHVHRRLNQAGTAVERGVAR